MLRPYKQFLSIGRVFHNVRLYRVESVRRVRKPPQREMLFDLPQKLIALGVAGIIYRHATLIVRRSCRRRTKSTACQPPQPRQCRPSQLIKHRNLAKYPNSQLRGHFPR
jgi:hypothetical protein